MAESSSPERPAAIARLREGTEVLRTGGGASLTASECNAVLDEIERVQSRAEKYAAALTEITVSRDSFGDDRLYANHAERVAYNALNGGRS